MSPDKELFLFNKFSQFFVPIEMRTPDKSCMAFGFAIGDGWYDLVENLLESLQEMATEHPLNFEGYFKVEQVKEKFGGLRFYWSGDLADEKLSEQVHHIIEHTERESLHICEDCGADGKLRQDRPWWRTLCDSCSIKDLDPELHRKKRQEGFELWKKHRQEWAKYGYKI